MVPNSENEQNSFISKSTQENSYILSEDDV